MDKDTQLAIQQNTNLFPKLGLVGLLLTGLVAQAHAEGIDVSGVTASITSGQTSLNTVGTAVLSVVVIVFLFFMIRRLLR